MTDRKSPTAVEPRYNTRQAARLAETPARPQVRTVPSPLPEEYEPLTASSAEAQSKFLEGVGIVTTQVEPLEEVLNSDTAELLSCALQHRRMKDKSIHLTDPYFVEEQWRNVLEEKKSTLIVDAADIMGELTTVENVSAVCDKGKEWLESKGEVPLCACKAHKCEDPDLFTDVLGELIPLQPPLNDDTGTMFANTVLMHIIKAANLRRLTVHSTRGGTVG